MQLKKTALALGIALACPFFLAACDGDDGRNGRDGADGQAGSPGAAGSPGTPGAPGSNGANGLVEQTTLYAGNEQCFNGGVRLDSGPDLDGDGELAESEITATSYLCTPTQVNDSKNFNRIAAFPVCLQLDATCDVDDTTAAEIVAASEDGLTLIYSDSPMEQVGFVDITDPSKPSGLGVLALAGEPTSVAVKGDFALVVMNTSADFINVSGALAVVDIASRSVVRSIDLGGQPDSVAVSPDGRYAAIAIENERDEDLGDGAPPQLPAGNLVIVDLVGTPGEWVTRTVELTGLADLYPSDPEPEYIDINSDNIAVVSLQENNHLVLVDLSDGSVVNHFSAGSVDLDQIDTDNESIISFTDSQKGVLREPDGVTWLSTSYFVTANEGDLDGGSRGFSVFDTAGAVIYETGNQLDLLTARIGHYPDDRSDNKGNEPENAEFGVFGSERYLFVNSERASVVFVYDVADLRNPVFKQVLPAAIGPEGALAIPGRNLLVVASEEDSRDDVFRSALNIYQYGQASANYPSIVSQDRIDGTPIPWAALSGLSADPVNSKLVYAVDDSYYLQNRIFTLDVSSSPAVINKETYLVDSNDILAALPAGVRPAGAINADKTVNIDPEGIAKSADGGFWIASEGSGNLVDGPVASQNLLVKTDAKGVITAVVTLPDGVNALQRNNGFEGVAEFEGKLYVAFQRAWQGETNVRIGIYDIAGDSWRFLFYPLDAVESQNGGWVGLSEITAIGDDEFMVIERDNQGGPDAAIKRLYRFSVAGLNDGDLVTKSLIRDVLPGMQALGGLVTEKIEGTALLKNGDVLMVNDNDGVEDSNGETNLMNLGDIL
ncbi:esterase-like activity of phytase family protein [Spongiibacter taiwanensis]|uniref:esterase-like activity of phytase family protein n=1 Tax=Spongiibacter taiwanensis TaxID=1748242 RepID=UPI00203617B4|nr:esterase-like activity of phytase family protein [Spongiibacter taiwanensis]USA43920.1 esterase-like activity of phytase family protein [Spongiibacter taiwanensis]